MPAAEAAISSSRIARTARPYLERMNMNISATQMMTAASATHRYVTLAVVPKPRPFWYSEELATPSARPFWPAKGRLLMTLTMMRPKPSVIMAR